MSPLIDREAPVQRAVVIHPDREGRSLSRDAEARLEEAVGLAQALDLDVREMVVAPLRRLTPATLFGTGKVEEIGRICELAEADVAVVDDSLTPVQQRNLEKAWQVKVIDRTGLILEIFARRARTREGRLQVELARLTYERSRLVRTWTHLERQRGGFGVMGGPGETQIETDRRLIGEKITKLKKELVEVRRTRTLQRAARKRHPHPTVALVGYTNAGKSTLFNQLTQSEVLAKDLLFATLDPAMRGVKLPQGTRIILSDTVGFIADLPTELVAAFRATLEEVLEADVIVHVRDAAHDESAAQKVDVLKVLEELGVEPGRAMLEVLNKIDLLEPEQRKGLLARNGKNGAIAVSALTGAGVPALLAAFEAAVTRDNITLTLKLDAADGSALAFAYRHAQVLERRDRGGKISLSLRIHPDDLGRFENRFPKKISIGQSVTG